MQNSAAPIDPQLIPYRARLRQPNGPFSPCTSGSSASSPTSTPSIITMPVIEVRKLSLPSILGADSPFMPFSSTKPRMPPPCASDFAQMTKTSAIGAFEIQVLEPVRR